VGRGWKPIETAPRDGTRVILFSMDTHLDNPAGFVGEGYWAGDRWDAAPEGWRFPQEFRRAPVCVTADLWQPLPEAPTVEWSYTIKLDDA
jgi:hypothetical protein